MGSQRGTCCTWCWASVTSPRCPVSWASVWCMHPVRMHLLSLPAPAEATPHLGPLTYLPSPAFSNKSSQRHADTVSLH